MDKVLLIKKPENSLKTIEIQDMDEPGELRDLLNCETMETVICELEGNKYRILLDENGRPEQDDTHAIKRISVLTSSTEYLFSNMIYGSVLLCRQKNNRLIGLTEEDITIIKRHIRQFPRMGTVLVV